MTTMNAPKLEWSVRKKSDGKEFLMALVEDWENSRKYDIGFQFTEDGEPDFIAYWSNRINAQHFVALDDAKSWCQAREDEAWAAANPPREYTDTEILDACDFMGTNFYIDCDGFVFWLDGDLGNKGRGKTRREAVTAYLRANPPASSAETAIEPEPAVEREMTVTELSKYIEEHNLGLGLRSNFPPERRWNVWNVWLAGRPYEPTDCYAPTLESAVCQCIAAIDAAKSPAAQPETAR